MSADELAGLRSAAALFGRLEAPESLTGRWRAEFIGPRWLQAIAPAGLALSPLRGWHGKRFDAEGQGTNLVHRHGAEGTVAIMQVERRASRIDGRPVLATRYAPGSPWLIRALADEFRQLDEQRLLGMMTVDRAGLRGLALPFLLLRD